MTHPTHLRATEMPPRGFYLAREAGQLAGVSGHTIGQWKHYGYTQASQVSDSYPNVYSYQDVAEAMVVHTLLDNGVALHKIGKAVRSLGETYGLNWPLIGSRLFVTVDGQLGAAEDDRLYDLSEHRYPWQEVLEVSEVRQIALDLKRGGWAVRFLPRLRHIEVDPDKVSGKPSIVGRRIAAEDVAVIARESGYSVLRHDYKLSQSQIDDAVAWWNKVTEYDEAA